MSDAMNGNINQRCFYCLYSKDGEFDNESFYVIYEKFTQDKLFTYEESIVVLDYYLEALFESDLGISAGIMNEFMNIVVPKLDVSKRITGIYFLRMIYKAFENARNSYYSDLFKGMYKKIVLKERLSGDEKVWLDSFYDIARFYESDDIKQIIMQEYSSIS